MDRIMIESVLTFLVIVALYAWLRKEKPPKTDEEIAEKIFKKYKL